MLQEDRKILKSNNLKEIELKDMRLGHTTQPDKNKNDHILVKN